jgi:outer membrane protein OmpA-like peptidoglycan-associated protein
MSRSADLERRQPAAGTAAAPPIGDLRKLASSWSVPEARIISDPVVRSIAPAKRLEGWPRTTAMQAAMLRDARKSARLGMRTARRLVVIASAALTLQLAAGSHSLAADCQAAIDQFNRAVDAGLENEAQVQIDGIAGSAECGQFQVLAQRRLAALRLSAAQILMARGRPVAEYDRLLNAAETTEVLWQASATLGEVRFGERRFVDAAQAYDRAIEIVKNETLTPSPPEKFEIEGLIARAAQARLLAANVSDSDGQPKFVRSARDQRDGTLGGIFSRSVRGITPQRIPMPITFEYAKASFTPVGKMATDELAAALKEQRPARIRLVGHTDVRGSVETNLKLSAARSEAVAAYLKDAGVEATIETAGVGANEPLAIPDSSGLSQEDIYALNRRVEFIRQ